jgi:hypothetical protein
MTPVIPRECFGRNLDESRWKAAINEEVLTSTTVTGVVFGQAPTDPIGLFGFVIVALGVFLTLDEEILLVA